MNENSEDRENTASLALDVLPAAQRRLWDELSATPAEFVLYGGTAIALRLGHRQSIDFDFFAFQDIAPDELMRVVPYLSGAKSARTQPNTLNAIVDRGGEVQVSFFGLSTLNQVRPPVELDAPRLKLASMIDLAGMKMSVIQNRAQAKDYLDIYALWDQTDITPELSVAAAAIIYGEQYNAYDTLKALAYFGEGDLAALPDSLKVALTDAVRTFDHSRMTGHIEELTS